MDHYTKCRIRKEHISKNNKNPVLLQIMFQILQCKIPKDAWSMVVNMVFDKKIIEKSISQADLFIERVGIYHKYHNGIKWIPLQPLFTERERVIFYWDINRIKNYYDINLDECSRCPYTQILGRLSEDSWRKTWGIGIDYMEATIEVIGDALNESCYLLTPRQVDEYTWVSYHSISPMYVKKRIDWLTDAIKELKYQLNFNNSYWNV